MTSRERMQRERDVRQMLDAGMTNTGPLPKFKNVGSLVAANFGASAGTRMIFVASGHNLISILCSRFCAEISLTSPVARWLHAGTAN